MRALYTSFASKVERYFRIDANYFLSGGFWLTVGQFVSIAFGLVTTILFANFMSETDYGVYRYLIGIAVIFSSFSLTGLGQSILQTAAKKYYGFYQETLQTNFLYSLPIIAFSLTGATYYWVNQNTTLAIGCALIAFLQPIINTFQFIPAFLQGSKRFKESTKLHTVRMLVITTLSIMALYFTQNILILFTVYLGTHLLTNIISHFVFHPKASIVPKNITYEYIKYAKHTSIRSLIGNVAYRLDTVIIFTQLGAVDLAIYTIANIIPEQIKASFKNISSLLLPKYSEHKDKNQIIKSIPKRSLQLFILFSIISFLYIVLSPFLYDLLFPKYENAVFFSQLVALSLPSAITVLPVSLLQFERKESELYLSNIQSSITMIILTLILIPSYGLLGAIVAKILSRYCITLISFYHLYKNG